MAASCDQPIAARTATATPVLCLWLLFFSGLTALVYQILWTRQLTLLVGIDVYAISTVISAFFAGLALGGFLFGRMADRSARPLLLYAWLEIGCALAGFFATWALAHMAPLFHALEDRIGLVAWLLPTTAATTLRKDQDPPLVLDGPFAETKEQLLGFYLVEGGSLEEILDTARELSAANPGGAYEIRPVGVYHPGGGKP